MLRVQVVLKGQVVQVLDLLTAGVAEVQVQEEQESMPANPLMACVTSMAQQQLRVRRMASLIHLVPQLHPMKLAWIEACSNL